MSKKYKKRRMTVIICIVIFCVVVFTYKLISFGYNIFYLNNLKEELSIKYNDLREEEKDLKIEIEKLKNDDYLAKYVREKYKYSKDGELVLSVDETKETIKEIDKEISINKVGLIGLSTVLGLVVIYVIFKKKR